MATKTLLTLAFVVIGVYYFWSRRSEFANLGWPSKTTIAIVGIAFMLNILIMSLFNTLVSRRLGANITSLESFALSIVTSAANFLLPLRAGTGMRGMYMKRVYGLAYSDFASTLFVFYVANILVASLLGTAAVTSVYLDRNFFALDLFLSFPIIFLSSAAFIMFQRGKEVGSAKGASWLQRLWIGYASIIGDRVIVLFALSLVLVSFIVSTFAWYAALHEYIPAITVPDSFLIVASQVLGGLVTVTAGGTGIQELAGIYVGHRLSMTILEVFAVLVWTKVLRIIISVVAAVPAAFFLNRRLAKASGSGENK